MRILNGKALALIMKKMMNETGYDLEEIEKNSKRNWCR